MKKKVWIFSIMVICLIIMIICLAINANAENTGGTAEQRNDEKTIVRMVASLAIGKDSNNQANIDILSEDFDKYVGSGKTSVIEKSSDIIEVTFMDTGNVYEINKNFGLIENNEEVIEWVSPSEIFDLTGENVDGLHIGDFVNYDAGTWTEEEIAAIQTGEIGNLVTANGSTDKPDTGYQFGGFTAGSSRNGNATSYDTIYNYVKDASTGSAITGWRVFDIDGDNVTLISAGNTEDYYHSHVLGETDKSHISEYILTGNVNSSWSTEEAATYQKRNWSNYINISQRATSATVLTKSTLDSWYSKYMGVADADVYDDSTFQQIYEESYLNYQNIVDNYSYYWLSAASNTTSHVYFVNPLLRNVNGGYNCAFGVRILVTLSSDVQFTSTKTGTKTITGGNTTTYGGDQTYNCWEIQ